jgi:hypothetical protein
MSTVSKFPTGCDCRCVSRCLPVLPAAKSRGSDWLQTVSSLVVGWQEPFCWQCVEHVFLV